MKNRAKCKLCGDVIESFHSYDYVACRCGEIAVDGGMDNFRCIANDFGNFLRVDDEGNEIVVKVVEKGEQMKISEQWDAILHDMSRGDMLIMLDTYIQELEEGDLKSLMLLIFSILRSGSKE